ncbi:MAG TPA: alpha-amylase [Porticoccaceae bacterium]|nr:alpha-amylase [Porticoccaceae bacterium]
MTELTDMLRARLRSRLKGLYGESRADEVLSRVEQKVTQHRALTQTGLDAAHWDETDAILITYGDQIQAPDQWPLETLRQFATEHLKGAFSTLHLLPFFPYSSDDGFSVIDYRVVNPRLGQWSHIHELRLHFDLMFDLVLNHVSRESLWFADYINNVTPYCDYFIEADPTDDLALVVRPRTHPLLAEVHTHRGLRYLWATFSHDQIDLNYANPEVLLEFVDILLEYVRHGARIVRLDAVAYLWKALGTPCIHLEQTHQVIKLFRDLLSEAAPGTLLLTETNVPHAENISYFGDSDEAQLVYQFSLPPLLLHAIHTGNARYLNAWARALEPPPPGCSFVNFVASHDGIGVRPLEGIVPEDEVRILMQDMRERGGFTSFKRNPDGSESPYELNISLFDAFRDPYHAPDEWQIPRLMLSQLIMVSMQGIPAVYFHSMVATPNDYRGVESSGVTRAINRRKWDRAELEYLIGKDGSSTRQVMQALLSALRVRRGEAAFHPDGPQRVLSADDQVFAIERRDPSGTEVLLALFNVTRFERAVQLSDVWPNDVPPEEVTNLLTGASLRTVGGTLNLAPYQAVWVKPRPVQDPV